MKVVWVASFMVTDERAEGVEVVPSMLETASNTFENSLVAVITYWEVVTSKVAALWSEALPTAIAQLE